MFGTAKAESFSVISDSNIDAVAPPGTGEVAVSVVTPLGIASSTSLGNYTYVLVASVTPVNGPATGGTDVTITGSGLSNVFAVYFGDLAAATFSIVSDTQITATTPAGAGSSPVTVVTVDGGESSDTGPTFAYESSASVSRVTQLPGPVVQVPAFSLPSLTGIELVSPLPLIEEATKSAEGTTSILDVMNHMAVACQSTSAWPAFWHSLVLKVENELIQPLPFVAVAGRPIYVSILKQYFGLAKIVPGKYGKLVLILGGAALAADELYKTAKTTYDDATMQAIFNCMTRSLPEPQDCTSYVVISGACGLVAPPITMRIDPSGTIYDTNGNPLSGATATLMQSDGASGPFTAPPTGSPIMVPSINPETSDVNGIFHWDVFAGYYQVTAAKAGCTDPGNASQSTVSTPTLQVPPPRVGLVLTLSCPGEAPPPLPSVSWLSTGSGPETGGTEVDVEGAGFTPSSSVSFGGTPASAVTVLSPTDISATAPAGVGTVDVRVTTAGGESSASGPDLFAYVTAPVADTIDTDGDGYPDWLEISLGKNPLTYCRIMRADVDGDGAVSILDLAKVAQYFTQAIPPAPPRFDQDGDNKISILDLAKMASVFTQHVTACP